MSDNKRLGKGLSAIFGDDLSDVLDEIQNGSVDGIDTKKSEILISEIRTNPYQPRKVFDDTKIDELAKSIQEHGVFTPILVRKSIQGYELIAGERRLRASKKIERETIPAIVVEFDDEAMMEIALLENIQRENLNVIEEANAYRNMIEKIGYTQEQLANRIGKSREHVTNLLRLLKLPTQVQKMVMDNVLTMSHVRPLVTLADEDEIVYFANRIIDEKLSVREVEKMIKSPYKKDRKEKKVNIHLNDVALNIEKKLQTKVKIDDNQIVIKYQGTSDLNRILEILGCIEEE